MKWFPSSITSACLTPDLNLSYSTSAPIGPADADIQVQLTKDHHPTAAYVERLREVLARQYPGVTFYVLPVDIVTQILNFGLSAPIDIQIVGPNLYGNRALAERMLNEVRYVPGAADARIQQPFDYPNMTVNVDRTRAAGHRPDAAECGAKPAWWRLAAASRPPPTSISIRKTASATTWPSRPRNTGSTRWPR